MSPSAPTGLEPTTPARIKQASVTELAAFRADRLSWFLQHVHSLEPRAGGAMYYHFGTAMHSALEAHHLGGSAIQAFASAWQAMMDEERAELGFLWPNVVETWDEHMQLGLEMLGGYLEADARASILTDYPPVGKVLATEIRLSARIPGTRGVLTGKIDMVTEREPGLVTLWDDKNLSGRHSSANLDTDDQLTGYAWLWWKRMGRLADEVAYNVLLKKLPLTKSGKPTTSKLFVRDITRRSEAQLLVFERYLAEQWRDMRQVALHPQRAYPNPPSARDYGNNGCQVHDLCVALMQDEDVGSLILNGYRVADPRD